MPSTIDPPHPFPARMAPEIALEALSDVGRRHVVLDPMAGSGTSLMVAKLRGHATLGFDTDPLAVTLANAWCNPAREDGVVRAGRNLMVEAERKFWTLGGWQGFPDADRETNEFVRYWFDSVNARQLKCLSQAIQGTVDVSLRSQLWCAFSRLIVRKQCGASRAMDLAHSRPHRVDEMTTTRPFERFMQEVERVAKIGQRIMDVRPQGTSEIRIGDARNLGLSDSSIDLVITSPPYLTAIDYMRAHKFSLIWMGYTIGQLRELRSAGVGSEAAGSSSDLTDDEVRALDSMGQVDLLGKRHQRIIMRYIRDMSRIMEEVSRVLKIGGKAVFVMGDSTIRGVFLRNSDAVCSLAESSDLRLINRKSRALMRNRRYLPPPDGSDDSDLARRMGHEVVLSFRRVSGTGRG